MIQTRLNKQRFFLHFCLLLFCSACSGLGEVNAGYVNTITRHDGRQGVGVNAASGLGVQSNWGFGAHYRAKVTREVNQHGMGAHVYLSDGGNLSEFPKLSPVVYSRFGADLIQVAHVDGKMTGGTLCPLLDLGVILSTPGLTLSTTIEYDWRLTDRHNDVFVGAFLGWGYGYNSGLSLPVH